MQVAIQILQGADRLLTVIQYFDVTGRHMQPALKHTATHRRHAVVEDGRQGIFAAAGQVLGQLKVTPRGGIHDNAILLALHGDATDMR
ncbi:hypothetical protein D3C73_1366650 [compost metagenome]